MGCYGRSQRFRRLPGWQEKSPKYEDIYLKRYENMRELKSGVDAYFTFYNRARFHQSLDYSVPDEMYESFQCNELEYKQAV